MDKDQGNLLEDNCIPIIHLTGDHFDIGKQVGRTFKGNIQTALRKHTTLTSKLLPFYRSDKGRKAYDQLLAAAEKHLPQYVDEIKGIAAGAEADFIQLFLLHIEADLGAMMQEDSGQNETAQLNEGCSGFFVRNMDWTLHVHSEDSDPGTRYLGCIWVADIKASETNGNKAESFIAFAYPGMIPGNAWMVNSYGLMMSGNIISQKQVFSPGMIPRRLLGRAVMNVKSMNDLILSLETLPALASAFNFMVSQRVSAMNNPESIQMASVEIAGKKNGNKVQKTSVTKFQYHFNEFQWMSECFYPDLSSIAREKRLDEFKEGFTGDPSTLQHIKLVMSDEKNKNYPYFRDGAPPDYLATANIAIADRYKDKLYIYKFKPVESSPSFTFDIRPWAGTGELAEKRLIKTN